MNVWILVELIEYYDLGEYSHPGYRILFWDCDKTKVEKELEKYENEENDDENYYYYSIAKIKLGDK